MTTCGSSTARSSSKRPRAVASGPSRDVVLWAEGHIPGSGFADLDRRPVRSVVAAALHAAHGRALRGGGDGAARCRSGHPGCALRLPTCTCGRPACGGCCGRSASTTPPCSTAVGGPGPPKGGRRRPSPPTRSPGGVPRQAPPRPVRRPRSRSSLRWTTAPPACSTPSPPAQHRGEKLRHARPGSPPGLASTCRRRISSIRTRTATCRPRRSGAHFAPVLDDPSVGRIVTYCGGGIAAVFDVFALWRLGHEHVAVYDASLQEWSADPALPLVIGE